MGGLPPPMNFYPPLQMPLMPPPIYNAPPPPMINGSQSIERYQQEK